MSARFQVGERVIRRGVEYVVSGVEPDREYGGWLYSLEGYVGINGVPGNKVSESLLSAPVSSVATGSKEK